MSALKSALKQALSQALNQTLRQALKQALKSVNLLGNPRNEKLEQGSSASWNTT